MILMSDTHNGKRFYPRQWGTDWGGGGGVGVDGLLIRTQQGREEKHNLKPRTQLSPNNDK